MNDLWIVPRMWTESVVYIIGGGPSVKEQLHLIEKLKGKRVIAVNDAYILGDWIPICFFGDAGWLKYHDVEEVIYKKDGITRHGIRSFPGMIVGFNQNKPRSYLYRIERKSDGFSTDPRFLAWNGNSGSAAINLAYLLGAKKIVLIGFDMQLGVDGNSNWHQNLKDNPNANCYTIYMKRMKKIDIEMKEKGVKIDIVNCSPRTQLNIFRAGCLEEEI